MKLLLGFLAGLAAGWYVFDNMTDEQRSNVTSKASSVADRVKRSDVAESVSESAQKVADATSERVTQAVDAAGDKATDAVSGDDPSTTTPSTTV